MQFQPFGLEPVDQNWAAMLGTGAPQLCAVLAADSRMYATGDVVWYDTASVTQYPVVAAAVHAFHVPVAYNSIVKLGIGVIVAVHPGNPQAPTVNGAFPIVPAGTRGSDALVWVLPAGSRRFQVAGDAKKPNQNNVSRWWWATSANYDPKPPTADGIEHGDFFADLVYSDPVGGRSGVALNGTSFNTSRHGAMLHVEGLVQGMTVAPRSKYIVTFVSR